MKYIIPAIIAYISIGLVWMGERAENRVLKEENKWLKSAYEESIDLAERSKSVAQKANDTASELLRINKEVCRQRDEALELLKSR